MQRSIHSQDPLLLFDPIIQPTAAADFPGDSECLYWELKGVKREQQHSSRSSQTHAIPRETLAQSTITVAGQGHKKAMTHSLLKIHKIKAGYIYSVIDAVNQTDGFSEIRYSPGFSGL